MKTQLPCSYSIKELMRWLEQPRTVLVARNVVASFSGRTINILSTIVAIPVAVHSLGQSQYGTLAIVISISTFFAYADFGLGTALVTELAEAEARGDRKAAQQLTSQVWFFLLGCAAIALTLGWIADASEIPGRILPSLPSHMAQNVWWTLICASALGIPLAIGQRIFFALQLGAIGQVWATIGRLAVLAGAFAAASLSPRLDTFVAVFILAPNLVAAASVLHLFVKLRPDLRPRTAAFSCSRLRPRMLTGFNFSLLQLLNFAESGADVILISQFYSPQIVAEYDLVSRLFGYIMALVGIGMWPLWPAISTAIAHRDFAWVVLVRRAGYAIVFLLSASVGGLFWFNAEMLIKAWTGVEIKIADNALLKSCFVLFVVLNSIIGFQQIFLTALNDMNKQAIAAAITIIIVIPIKYMLLSHGLLYGAVLPTVVLYMPRIIYFDLTVRSHFKVLHAKMKLPEPKRVIV